MADLIKIAEEAFATGKEHPKFKAGDTVTVAYKIVAWSSRFQATRTKNVSRFAKCPERWE